MIPVPVDLSKLSDLVKADFVKKSEYDKFVEKVNAIQNADTSDLVKKTDYNTKLKRKLLIMIVINLLLLRNLIS